MELDIKLDIRFPLFFHALPCPQARLIGAQLIQFFAHLFYALHLPKAGMNRDQQQLEIYRLDQVRVRSFLQANQNIFPTALGSQEYERHFGEQDVLFTNLLQQFVTVF